MITLLVMTDGRPGLIDRTIVSAETALAPSTAVTERFVYADDHDQAAALTLARRLLELTGRSYTVMSNGRREGFGGAIRAAWQRLRHAAESPFIFHLEDDFTFNRDVPLERMAETLRANPQLAQMALRRQAWNTQEKAAGGVVELRPDDYEDVSRLVPIYRSGPDLDDAVYEHWLEHRLFFTTNPCLYRRDLMRSHDWPDGAQSEGVFTRQLRDEGYSFAYWGRREDEPWVTHIGVDRAGTGY